MEQFIKDVDKQWVPLPSYDLIYTYDVGSIEYIREGYTLFGGMEVIWRFLIFSMS